MIFSSLINWWHKTKKSIGFGANQSLFLTVNVTEESIQYGILHGKGDDKYQLIYSGVYNQWSTNNGQIYDFKQLGECLKTIKSTINNNTGIQCKELILCLSLNYFKVYNQQESIKKSDLNIDILNRISHTYDDKSFVMAHDCGKIFLVDNTIPVDNLDTIEFEKVDIYSSVYLIPTVIQNNLTLQIKNAGFIPTTINCPHYLLCAALSENLKNDIMLIELRKESSTIIINHRKFSYNCTYINTGYIDLFGKNASNNEKTVTLGLVTNNKEGIGKLLNAMLEIAKMNQKATIVICGEYGKKIDMVRLLQRISDRRFFYLDSLTSAENNGMFFNLINNYSEYLIPKQFLQDLNPNDKNNLIDKLSDLLM